MYQKALKQTMALALFGVVMLGGALTPPKDSLKTEAKSATDKLFAGGKGTKSKPYQIKTAKQFANIGKNKTTLKKYYVLKKNINFKNKTVKNIGSVTMAQMGKGNMAYAFSGSFNGKGHTISNIKVKQETNEVGTGLFEISTGTVKNLTVKNTTTTGTGSSMVSAGVVGMAYGGTVSNVKLTGKNNVSGVNCIGGIVGGGWGAKIKKCSVSGTTITVNGNNDFSTGVIVQEDVAECGGLIVGGGFTGSVTDCTAKGTVKATGNEPVGLGGIGGCLQCMDLISGNTANVTIQAKNGHAIGGLCGYAGVGDDGDGIIQEPAKIKNCSVTVKIVSHGATHVGGLIGTGLYYYGMEDRFNVIDCSVKGSIDGAVTPGTVAGRAEGSIITSCQTDVTVDGVKSSTRVGTTSQLYQSSDQYPEGSKEAAAWLLKNVSGTHQGLFETICDEKYFGIWKKYAASVVGEEKAEETVKLLQSSVTAPRYGQEAIDYYTENPNAMPAFNCFLTQSLSKITFDGNKISGYDALGNELFSHEYTFDSYSEATGMGLYAYKTADADAGEFTYIVLAADTPAATYHIEFRYGDDLSALNSYATGKYAYWMAAGIRENPSDVLIENVIRLFVIENLKAE